MLKQHVARSGRAIFAGIHVGSVAQHPGASDAESISMCDLAGRRSLGRDGGLSLFERLSLAMGAAWVACALV